MKNLTLNVILSWTKTEELDFIRRSKYSKKISKLDPVTQVLNRYRRLKHSG
jgi:hypothetical protein